MSALAVVDYGAGNLRSVGGALDVLGIPWRCARRGKDLIGAGAILLPGVGSARSAMRELETRDLVPALRAVNAPLLGICLGLQLLFQHSEEEGGIDCLGLVPGSAARLSGAPKLPHMGWNLVRPVKSHPLLRGIDPGGEWFYFAHSFAPRCPDELKLAVATYGTPFVAAAARGKICGVQFHPEKSGEPGLRLLANFLRWAGLLGHDAAPDRAPDRPGEDPAAAFPAGR